MVGRKYLFWVSSCSTNNPLLAFFCCLARMNSSFRLCSVLSCTQNRCWELTACLLSHYSGKGCQPVNSLYFYMTLYTANAEIMHSAGVQSRHQTPVTSGGGQRRRGGSRRSPSTNPDFFLCQRPGAALTFLNDSL